MDPPSPAVPRSRYGDPSLGAEHLRALGVAPLPDPAPASGVVVERRPDGVLRLRLLGPKAPGPVAIEFEGAAFLRRLEAGRRGPLGRAVGLAKGARPLLWDLTAGLGRDAVWLAAHGATVVAHERDPLIHALLADAVERGRQTGGAIGAALTERFTLARVDGIAALRGLAAEGAPVPDVLFLDPMFPERGSALAKKEAQLLAALLGGGADEAGDAALFTAACESGVPRIVVKRPRHAPTIVPGVVPVHRFEGRSVRFDLYLTPVP